MSDRSLAFAVIMIVSMPASAQAVDEPWPMFKQNPLHTGVASGNGPTNLTVKMDG